MSRPDFIAGFMRQGKSAFVPHRLSWIINRSRPHFHALWVSRCDMTDFIQVGGTVYACGRDPYFPAWPDVLQLNAFEPSLRQAAIETISSIAQQCDGIRCDMAMLFLNQI